MGKLGTLAAAAAIIGATWAGADALNIRFVHQFEQQDLERDLRGEIEQLAGVSLEYILVSKRRRLFEVEQAIALYISKQQQPPFHLVQERDILTDEIADLRRRLGK